MAAGLGAAVMTGAATASASTDDAGGSSTSASSDSAASESTSPRDETASPTGGAEVGGEDATDEDTTGEGTDEEDTGDPADENSTGEDTADDETEVVDVGGSTDDATDDSSDDATGDATDEDAGGEDPVDEGTDDEGVATPAPVAAVKDPDDDTSTKVDRRSNATRSASLSTDQEPVDKTTTVTTALQTTAATVPTDPVLIAAATSTKVTVGSMIVDMLYSWGIRSSKMGTDWLNIAVSQRTATRWLARRAQIYRGVVIPQPGNPTDPGTPTTPKLLWETNFSSIDEAMKYWGFQTGRWGQSAGENQYYTDGDNVYIDAAGNLVIDARREAAPDGMGAPYNYTSARVVTMGKQSFGVGQRVVARIQMPVTKGVLPAFWSVGLEPGHEYDWPRQGEIDIVEIPTLGTPTSASTWTGNIHGPAAANNTVDVKLHNINADLGVDLSQGFHDYGIDWHADRIVWHVDGVAVGQITKAQYEALGGNWTPFSGAWEHYLILNVAVGNPWNGDPDPTKPFHAQMKVDWVKAYAL
ncbi:beta-glucanase (GH16 family) [Mycolicibacterium iranicum]|uniref:Beta-glucanase (GH16 family) n=1 Tax=Mycolicibacterium iranicum TaxID=912594 RepID=A0A839Q3Q1_MYCIR|nr:family 16 glycosylhydrolase [Mycolicibacterium iranicum]MBB2990519.1 beta-glucanase (GH16 family) [Mycolicibacterium iranicum]